MDGDYRYLKRRNTRSVLNLKGRSLKTILENGENKEDNTGIRDSKSENSGTNGSNSTYPHEPTKNSDHKTEDINVNNRQVCINSDNSSGKMAELGDIENLFKKYGKSKQTLYALEPSTFSGSTYENATEWIQKFEDYCTIQNITDYKEKSVIFSALLKSGAHCWYKNLKEADKETWDKLKNSFLTSYGESNKWISQFRLEQRVLRDNENVDSFIQDMTSLAVQAGVPSSELSRCLIRALPDDLKWQVIAFNPKTVEETIERILLAESSCKWKTKQECNTVEERISSHRTNDMLETLSKKMAELEVSFSECKKNLPTRETQQHDKQFRPPCKICGKNNHVEARCFRNRRGRGTFSRYRGRGQRQYRPEYAPPGQPYGLYPHQFHPPQPAYQTPQNGYQQQPQDRMQMVQEQQFQAPYPKNE